MMIDTFKSSLFHMLQWLLRVKSALEILQPPSWMLLKILLVAENQQLQANDSVLPLLVWQISMVLNVGALYTPAVTLRRI